jgi:hypothetical protein
MSVPAIQIATLRLWVSPEQLPARRLYERLGFRVVAESADDDDRLIMERPARP